MQSEAQAFALKFCIAERVVKQRKQINTKSLARS